MSNRLRPFALVSVTALALGVAAPGLAGPEKVAFPTGFAKGVLYTTADRYDVKQQDFVISYPAMAGRTRVASAAPVAAGAVAVNIMGFAFGPTKATVESGKPVVWTNSDLAPHQITFTKTQERSPILVTDQSHTQTFATPGVHDYICGLHPDMKGSVEVK